MKRSWGGGAAITALYALLVVGWGDIGEAAESRPYPMSRISPERPMLQAGASQGEPSYPAAPSMTEKRDTKQDEGLKNQSQTEPPKSDLSSAGESIGIAVTSYHVEGNTILAEAKVEEILNKYKGTSLQLKEIEKARQELEKAYHMTGYPTVLVLVPEQTIEEGTVRLQVVEGRLGEITVTGNKYYDKYSILGKLPSLKRGSVLYEPTFTKELDAMNAIPDLKVAPVLKPGEETGQVDLELKVKDRLPVHGRLDADNRGPITTPRNRLVAQVQHANLFGGDEIFTVQTVQTPTDWGAVQNYGASFVAPIVWPNHLLSLFASKSQSKSVLAGQALSTGSGDISIAGNATIAGVRYLFPILPGRDGTHQVSVGVDYKRLEKTVATFPGGLGTAIVLNEIQYTPVSIGYSGSFPDSLGLSRFTATAKGYVAGMIPGGRKKDFTGDPVDPVEKPPLRVGSTGTFAVLQSSLDRMQPLPWDFNLAIHVDGQWASQPLIPAEQYFAGGMDTVRGYINYETAGDHAARGRVELTSPELFTIPIDRFWQRRRSAELNFKVRVATFYDAAKLWVAQPLPGQISKFKLEGTGFGLRAMLPKDVGELRLDQGWALRDTPTTKRGDTFLHFSVGIGF